MSNCNHIGMYSEHNCESYFSKSKARKLQWIVQFSSGLAVPANCTVVHPIGGPLLNYPYLFYILHLTKKIIFPKLS